MFPSSNDRWLNWAQLSARQIGRLAPEAVVIMPVAAIEQHGPHLPTAVDAELVNGILERAAALWHDAGVVLQLPTLALGFSSEHVGFPGTLSLSSTTLIRLWTEVAESVHASGARKLLIFNSHGGQVGALDLVARDLRARLGLMTVTSSWFQLPLGDALAEVSAHEHRFGVHGGQVETAMMLALAPQTVDMGLARNFDSSSQTRAQSLPVLGDGRSAKLAWLTRELNASGAVGQASAASADLGHRVLDAAARGLVGLLQDMQRIDAHTGLPQESINTRSS